MIYENPAELRDRIEELAFRRILRHIPIFEDTSSYMTILGGSVLRLGGNDYFVMGEAREGRFGIDEQPKHWVKYAVDLGTGAQKIIKLVFHEEFETELGLVRIRCRRSPEKESAILRLVRGDPRFMQGRTLVDPVGNQVRVIDFIRGQSLYSMVCSVEEDHETYFHHTLPVLFPHVIGCLEALASLHSKGQHHGDVRNDHILIERDTGRYIWIDFDYAVNFQDYDIWSLGNVLTFVVGKGIHTFREVFRNPELYPQLRGRLGEDDACLLSRYRVANLQKLFPYIPDALNAILLRFSESADAFYESIDQQVRDLKAFFT